MPGNRQIVVAELPTGPLREDHFRIVDGDVPVPGPGEVLCRNILVSLDPAARIWLTASAAYRTEHPGMEYEGEEHPADGAAPQPDLSLTRDAQPLRDIRKVLRPGDVMDAFTLCEVVDANGTDLRDGDIVLCMAGWQEYAAVPAAWARPIEVVAPLTQHLGVLAITGLTAYRAIVQLAKPRPGETVVISSAAGAVGTIAGQMAKIAGARVVGLTRSDEKNAFLERELGFDATVNYAKPTFAEDLAAACPDGADVYLDNTGGPILETALEAMADHGRVICCGVITQYDTPGEAGAGISNVPLVLCVKRLTMTGMTVTDFSADWPAAEREMAGWIADGRMKVIEEVLDGLDSAPAGLVGLFSGTNIGKRTVRVGPDPG
jgi:NADPH-dependent curcumin reductase CurA